MVFLASPGWTDPATRQTQRDALAKTMKSGNFKDALEGYRKLVLDPEEDRDQAGPDLKQALDCLNRLGRIQESDVLIEAAVKLHAKNWRLLQSAAERYLELPHQGYLISGQFSRGHHRGGGEYVNAQDRDRIRALQLLEQARPLLKDEPDTKAAGDFYFVLANAWILQAYGSEAWRLQVKSDLSVLPEFERGWGRGGRNRGAPVDSKGEPVYHRIPSDYEKSVDDGQRWRWALAQAATVHPGHLNKSRLQLAQFCQSQFGVQTMSGAGFVAPSTDEQKNTSGPYALRTLTEDETIARLATGIRRFKLPDEFNYVKIYMVIAAEPKTGQGDVALGALAQEFEDRQQYPRAAEVWRQAIKAYGPGDNNVRANRLQQIVGNWGRFENIATQKAGQGAEIQLTFRNAKQIEFEAHALKVEDLLNDVKSYLKTEPGRVEYDRVHLDNLGYKVVEKNETKYLGAVAANWKLDLEPRPEHLDQRLTITTPLQKSGAYLLKGKVKDGNTTRIIVWLTDTVILKKSLQDKNYYFIADATTGVPVGKAQLEFFGYKQEYTGNNKFTTKFANFAEATDDNGQAFVPRTEMPQQFQWVTIARTESGRFAHMGFNNTWYSNYNDGWNQPAKIYAITDRPVYRPGQAVKYKFWVRNPRYDEPEKSEFAGAKFKVEIVNPKGEKVLEKDVVADEYGGFDGEWTSGSDATLGDYQIYIPQKGGGRFRLEEYKKPEFEVTVDAPTEPVKLGEKVTATIKAKYYFGTPVTEAQVKFTVQRTAYSERWYPIGRWDWFYGPGYRWLTPDYNWYPGFNEWGCRAPHPWWFGGSYNPPELVSDQEVAIGPDGTVKVEIETAIAKALHGDQDHQYTITAEVVDQSRRTIVGTGKVLVARKPFQVVTWLDRGYYQVGDSVQAHMTGRTLNGKPVPGQGKLTLYQISYNAKGEPEENVVDTWQVATDAQGLAQQTLKAGQAGQYRLLYQLTDAKANTIEGGYLFLVAGPGFTGTGFRFNDLELIPEKAEYNAGQKAKVLVNTNHLNATVLFFARPANGIYLPPKLLKVNGKSVQEELAIQLRDMPNFFVEAVTISGGQIHTQTREIVVPPEERMLNVEVQPSSKEYRPGEKATIQVKLTDPQGKPFVGSTVLTVYDKALEYISGGSNVPEIREFFWKWRRHHSPRTESNIPHYFSQLLKSTETSMRNLGVFGALVGFDGRGEGKGQGFGGGGLQVERQYLRKSEANGMADAAAAPMAALSNAAGSNRRGLEAESGGAQGGDIVQPMIRQNFADSALWVSSLKTKADGTAEVKLNMPENLTAWNIRVWGLGAGTKVGQSVSEVVTKKDLIVRLQTPRFFVEKDEVVLSANVHNYLKQELPVQVVLELEGDTLKLLDKSNVTVRVPANGEERVDFRVRAVKDGEAIVRVKALTDVESDAMQMKLPVQVHGMLKTEAWTGVIRPDRDSSSLTVAVPAQRRINETRLEIRYSPTLAAAMIDAIPYLVDPPQKTTEATLNSFLPTILAQKVLLDMKVDLKALKTKKTNLNPQEIGDRQKRAEGWKRGKDDNPVYDQEKVALLAKQGLRALTEMQLSDGGWGWFSGYGEHSSAHMTALIVHGLQIAKQNGLAIVPGVLERGQEWLKQHQDRQVQMLKNADGKITPYKTKADNLDALVHSVLVDANVKNDAMRDFLYRDRVDLTVYGKTLLGLALHKLNDQPKLKMVLQNIAQFVVQDDENQTAYLQMPEDNRWWSWYGDDAEAHAYYLRLLSRTEPKGELASRLVKYLLNNRKHASYWNSSRDTAICLESMGEFLKASGESQPNMTVELWLDGQKKKEVQITPENLFTIDNTFVLEGDAVSTGPHQIEFKRKGTGPLYYNAYLTNFTLEDPITKTGLEIRVERKFYKLVQQDASISVSGAQGQALSQKIERYQRVELANLAGLKSGDLVEVELSLESKNDYEYLMFEDWKAAGFEPVELRSGYNGNALQAYMELRDNRVAFFARTLARGRHSVAYRLRAEIPGQFSALPATGSGVYAPELKANSDEMKLRVID